MRQPDSTTDIAWVAIGAGRLALWHRPALKRLSALRALGCDCLVTLLAEREGAQQIGAAAQRAGMDWLWLPIANADIPEGEERQELEKAVVLLSSLLDQGHSLIIHCSAGIHRTGMIAYALLRFRGHNRDSALEHIAKMRGHTHRGLQPRLLVFGDDLAETRG